MANISNIDVNGIVYDLYDKNTRHQLGNLTNLTTEEKSNIVAAINELKLIIEENSWTDDVKEEIAQMVIDLFDVEIMKLLGVDEE
jgi:hypothetical protein